MAASQPANFNLQEFTDVGQLLVGGRLYTYAYGTTAQKTAYTDPAGTVPHTYTADGSGGQYIALNARGELPAPLYLGASPYDLALKRADGSTVWTRRADGVENSLTAQVAALAASGGADLVGDIQAGANSVARTQQAKNRDRVSLKDKGAVGNGITDDTAAVEGARTDAQGFEVPAGTYKVNKFATISGHRYVGVDRPVIAFTYLAAIVWLAFQSNSVYEGIIFQSNEPNLENQRGAVEDVTNVTIRNCALKGFRHASAQPNAWGLHIARSSGITIDHVEFANNSQSDIAITDNVQDVTIINAQNPTDGGVLLNVEPNTQDGVNGLNVIGGHYRAVYLQDIENRGYGNRNIVFTGARVDALYYDGAGVRFLGCDIGTLSNAPDGVGAVYAGGLMIDNCDLGPNLFSDPYLFDISNTGASFWNIYASGAAPYYSRVNDATYGKYLRVNPNKGAGDYYPTTQNAIAVTAGETLLFFMRARCDNTSTSGIFTALAFVQWKNAANAVISTTNIKTCRGAFSSFTDWNNDIAILIPPAGAVSAVVFVGVTGNVLADIASVGLFRPKIRRYGMGNMPEIIGRLSRPNLEREFYRASAPAGAQQWPGYFVGERVINSAPAVGQPRAWTCTTAGSPGTWSSEGVL